MAARTKRISSEEWERHRRTVCSLFLELPLRQVKTVMHEEHGFDASIAQFEARLKLWGVRKNLKRREWETLFEQGEDPHVEGTSGEVVVTPTGLRKSNTSVVRARRWVWDSKKRASPESRNANKGDSEKDHNQPNLEHPFASDPSSESDRIPKRSKTTGEITLTTVGGSRRVEAPSVENDSTSQLDIDGLLGTHLSPLRSLSVALSASTMSRYGSLDVTRSQTQSGLQHEGSGWNNITFHFGASEKWFKDLPFAKFEEISYSRGIDIIAPSTLLPREPETCYRADDSQQQSALQWTMNFQDGLQGLNSFLPEDRGTLVTADVIPEADLTRRLLFSLLNGFAGLEGLPQDQFFRFLRQLGTPRPVLLRMFRESPPIVSKAFAENIFRAAIEVRDEPVAKLLIEYRLVDVNSTVCLYDDQKYTAVERAASLESYGLVEMLTRSDADVNKTYSTSTSPPKGALDQLINAVCKRKNANRGSAITARPDLLGMVNLLVAVGATLSAELLESVVIDLTTPGLAYCVSSGIPKSKHQILFREHYSYRLRTITADIITVARYADDSNAARIIGLMIDSCRQSDCRVCLVTYARSVEQAAFEGAVRGHLQLVRLLIDHVQSPRSILSGALRSNNQLLVDFLIKRGADISPATCRPEDGGSYFDPLQRFPPPLLNAVVGLDNADLMRRPGVPDAFKHVLDGGHLEALIAAAAEEGSLPSLRRLLYRATSSKQSYRPSAFILVLAIKSGNEAVVRLLLDSGAWVDHHRNIGPWDEIHDDRLEDNYTCDADCSLFRTASAQHEGNWADSPLQAALKQRNADLVRAILSSDIHGAPSTQAFEEIANWGDSKIMTDLVLTFPELRTQSSGLRTLCQVCIAKDNMDFFQFFVKLIGSPPSDTLAPCLGAAIEAGHTKMINYLVSIGADPFSRRTLKAVVSKRPDLLQKFRMKGNSRWTTPLCVTAESLQPVMTDEPGNAEALETVLEMDLVNLSAPAIVYSDRWQSFQNFLTPLGLAIRGSSDWDETNFSAVERLLNYRSDPNGIARISVCQVQSNRVRISQTALTLAIETGRRDTVKLLIRYGGDINKKARLSIKQTPLQCAAERGSLEIVRLLLNHGAHIRDEPATRSGGTALQFAAISGNCNVAAELLEWGAQLDALPSKVNGRWPLEGAAEHGRLDMIQFLWNVAEDLTCSGPLYQERQFSRVMDIPGFQARHCLRAMSFAQDNGHIGCRDLISSLSQIPVLKLESEEYGAPWLAY